MDKEFTNRVHRKKGGVCLYISDEIKNTLRKDLCKANENFESCFVEIDNPDTWNTQVGVVYRLYTAIDYFVDIDPIFEKVTNERKKSHKPTHEFLNPVYSYSFMPTIYKPTRITESSATIIDNILVNEVTGSSAILVTDISDHPPTVFVEKRGLKVKRNENKFFYKRNHSLENINRLKQTFSNLNWHEELIDNNANDSYNEFIDTFVKIYDEYIQV